jgi:ABC-2 type transport system ATP-binding protein
VQELVLRTQKLTKSYRRQRGIVDLDLMVYRGEVFGYLGPNGAGKTTTIRLLLDLIRPTNGTATLFGLDSHRDHLAIARRVGYLPGELALYEDLTGAEFLRYLNHLRQLPASSARQVRELSRRLDCDLTRPIRTLSHGNRQKIGLVSAFVGDPELIILDEPSLGLDPLVQHAFYGLVAEVKAGGRTVFMSSHILPEVERVCDRAAVIREGNLVTVERVDSLKARALRRLEIHFAQPVRAEAFATVAGVQGVEVDGTVLRCAVLGSLDALVKAAAQFEVLNLIHHEPSLEEAFLAFYQGGEANAR